MTTLPPLPETYHWTNKAGLLAVAGDGGELLLVENWDRVSCERVPVSVARIALTYLEFHTPNALRSGTDPWTTSWRPSSGWRTAWTFDDVLEVHHGSEMVARVADNALTTRASLHPEEVRQIVAKATDDPEDLPADWYVSRSCSHEPAKRDPSPVPPLRGAFETERSYAFCASHNSLGAAPDDPRHRPHAHTWRVRLVVSWNVQRGAGGVDELDVAWRDHVARRLDGQLLNEVPGLANATLDHVCLWIAHELTQPLAALGLHLRRVEGSIGNGTRVTLRLRRPEPHGACALVDELRKLDRASS